MSTIVLSTDRCPSQYTGVIDGNTISGNTINGRIVALEGTQSSKWYCEWYITSWSRDRDSFGISANVSDYTKKYPDESVSGAYTYGVGNWVTNGWLMINESGNTQAVSPNMNNYANISTLPRTLRMWVDLDAGILKFDLNGGLSTSSDISIDVSNGQYYCPTFFTDNYVGGHITCLLKVDEEDFLYEIPDGFVPYAYVSHNYAYLSNNNLYTGASLTNLTNNWSGLSNTAKEALVSSFDENIPSIQDLATISPFRVLIDNTSLSNVKVTGQPEPQIIEPTSLINTGAVSTIQSINITNTLTDATVKFAITTDLTTYKVYDAITSSWVVSTNIEEDGMSIAQINALTPEILALLDISNGIAFKQCFIATSENALAELSDISAVVNIDGSWTQSVHGTDYNVTYPNKTTMSVRLLTNGDYIINYPISSNS